MPLTPINIKLYTAIMQQSGTAAPTATILKNDIGNITWTRTDVGTYTGTLTGAFTDRDKIAVFTAQGLGAGWTITAYPPNDNEIMLVVALIGATDNWQNVYIEIRKYSEPQHE